jgi:cytochrome P450
MNLAASPLARDFMEHVVDRGRYGALPPGPLLPPAVQLVRFMFTPRAFLGECKRRFGSPFTLRLLGTPPVVIFSEPDAIRDLVTGDPDVFWAGKANGVLEPFLGQHSVILLDGERHRSQRRLMTPPFRGEALPRYGATIRDVTKAELRGVPHARTIAFHDVSQRITLEVILRTVFGAEGAQLERLRSSLTRALRAASNPGSVLPFLQIDLGPRSPWGRFVRARDEVDAELRALIDRARREGADRFDVLSKLAHATHDDGAPMSDEEIRDEIMTLVVAGHETTATALAWAVHELTDKPAIQAKAFDEIRAARVGGELPVDADLPYVDAICKEALRLHPVIPGIGRALMAPATIGGVELPANVMAAASIVLTHLNPALYPDPERFDPERFVDKRVSPYEYLPFGGGGRRCLGMYFALYEMRLILAYLLDELELAAAASSIRTVRRNITLAPSAGMPIRVRPRG